MINIEYKFEHKMLFFSIKKKQGGILSGAGGRRAKLDRVTDFRMQWTSESMGVGCVEK